MTPFLTLAFTLMTAATSMAAAVPSTTPFHLDGQERSIVGGTEAAAGEFPYIVSLARIGKSHFCGGVLINAYTVVTAAHCTVDQTAEELNVRAGSLVSHFPLFSLLIIRSQEAEHGRKYRDILPIK